MNTPARHWLAYALLLAGLASLGLMSGCASPGPALTLPMVGPISGGRPHWVGSTKGYLRVHTATELQQSGSLNYHVPKPYWVYNLDGRQVRGVPNHTGLQDQQPATIALPPGRYVVHAPAERYGLVRVPVLILPERLTLVFLEGKGLPEAGGLPPAEVVRLPDGTPVGRLASQASPSNPR